MSGGHVKISIVVATNRSAFWRVFCDALARNSAEVEVLFVGPVGVGEPGLPVPTRFIDVPDLTVGAARCWEIGARAVKTELLGLVSDDVVFTPGFLDAVVDAADDAHNDYDTFTARYVHNGKDSLADQRMWSDPHLPLLPLCGFSYTEGHHKIGGIDKRFNAVFWDADLYMEMRQLGGVTTLLADHVCEEHLVEHRLCQQNAGHDGAVLAGLWPAPLHAGMKRVSERQRWEDYAA